MRNVLIVKILPGAVAVVGFLLIFGWLTSARQFVGKPARVPGTDGGPATNTVAPRPGGQPTVVTPGTAQTPGQTGNAGNTGTAGQTVTPATSLLGTFRKFGGSPANLPGAWPCFRGAQHDNISRESAPLLRQWPAEGPQKLWSLDLGEGHAGAAVLNGRVYVLDYDQAAQADALRCFSLADGNEIWRRSYPVSIKRNHGMSRTVPAVTDKYVVTLGPKCHLLCTDAVTGEARWAMDLTTQFRTVIPPWYAGQCPLIDGDRVIIAPGSDALMVALDLATGRVLWKTPNPRGWTMTHSSILPLQFHGTRMYVYCGSGGVAGISAADGKLLWDTTEWRVKIANVPTPVDVGDGKIFFCGGYNAGCMMMQLQGSGGKFSVSKLFALPATTFGSDQQTPIFTGGYLYGVIPGGQLACLDPQGKVVWTSGAANRFGIGPYMLANGLLFIMNDAGLLTLVELSPDAYKPLAQARVLTGHDSWGPMALAGGRLIVRDLTKMVCLKVGE